MQPKPEHRISALEKRAATLEATLEELSSDQAEELRAIRQHIDQGFEQAHAFVQERFTEINTRLDRIETTMATKEDLNKLRDEVKADIATMKNDLLDAIKHVFQQRPGGEK